MNVGLKPMVDLSMQDYGKHTGGFQDDIGGNGRAKSLSPVANTFTTGVYDPRSSPILFSLSPDWKHSTQEGTLEVESLLEKDEQTQSLSVPEFEFRHSGLLPLKQSEAYSAPSNLQIQSHSLFAFRTSYSGAFLTTADDLRDHFSCQIDSSREHPISSRNQPGFGLESSTNAVERGLRRQDSDASVDDLIFREWRKMRPRTSLLRDDSMASLASLPRTESEISIDGERVHFDEGLISNLRLDSVEDLDKTVATAVDSNAKEFHESIPNKTHNGFDKQSLYTSSLDCGSSSTGILKPIIEQDSYMNRKNELRGPFWELYGWNEKNVQSPANSGCFWSESASVSNVSMSSTSMEGKVSNSLSQHVSLSSPTFLDNSKLLGNCRHESVSLPRQHVVVHSSMPPSILPIESDSNLFYKEGLKPTTAAAAAIASAASAANKVVPRSVKGYPVAPEIYRKMDNSLEARGLNANYLSPMDYPAYASIPSSYSWTATDPSFQHTTVFSGNNYRRNLPFAPTSTSASVAISLTGNPSASKVWSMEEIVGRIFELAKDQHGCRFLQMKLEEGNPAYIAMILAECFDGLAELMVDPFGNYLCQKLFEYCNFQQRLSILQHTSDVLAQISMNMHGTRVVQRIIECIEGEDQVSSVCAALAPFASQLMKDVNGNHVIQRCLQKVSPNYNQFIFDAVVSHCVELATHRHGCCVIQRCLDYAIPAQKEQVCMEICENAFTLVQDAFGNYVVQYVLDLKNRFYIAKIIAQLAGHLFELSVQKFSSNVVEKCLQQVDAETRKHLIYELMSDRELLGRLLHDAYGNYVVQRALQLAQSPQLEQFCEIIRPHLSSLKSTPYGKRIYSKIVRRFPESCS